MTTEKTKIGVIDLTPTWEDQCQACLAILEEPGTSEQAKAVARSELRRMARLADAFKAHQKAAHTPQGTHYMT